MIRFAVRAPCRRRLLAALAACALPAILLCATPAHGAGVAGDIRLSLAPAGAPVADGERLYAAGALAAFYAGRNDAPGWVSEEAPLPTARAMLDAIEASGSDGLRPRDYHLERIEQLLEADYAGLPPALRARRLAALDLLLSDAFLQLAADESGGRVERATLDPRPAVGGGGAKFVHDLQAAFRGAAPAALLESLAPDGRDYLALRAALARLRSEQGRAAPPAVTAGGLLREGDAGARVAELIRRLQAGGDLASGAATNRFDAAVAAAVRRFQARHGLAPDGIVGPATLAALDEPPAYWIDRLRVAMERQRWLPRKPPPTRVVVNIAAFRATLYAGGTVELAERAIVGREYRQTPEFESQIRYLVVNPSWEVPASIAAQEILPAVQKNPAYLTEHGYEVLAGWGPDARVVDPSTVRWRRLSPRRLPYHFRQAPGADNPLGHVKFVFPNPYDVYMHDTPARQLFDATRRTFSHGCIRVEHAARLAGALLRLDGRDDPGLLLIEAAGKGDDQRIVLRKPVPIYIVYMTAWIDETGMLQFRPDVYGRDARVLAALDAPLPGGGR